MTLKRLRTAGVAIGLGILASGPALAECGGASMLPGLAQSDPAGHAAMFERAHTVPNAQGRFWKIEKPGVAPSYLLGTYHNTQAVETLPESVWEHLDTARSTWFEISLEEKERMEADMLNDPLTLLYDMSLPPLSQRIPATARPVLEAALAERGVPMAAAEQMRGWMLFSLLGFPACQLQAIQSGEVVLDAALALRAAQNGIPNHGLETYEQSLAAIEAMSSTDVSAMMVDFSAALAEEEDYHRTMLELYAQGEIMAIYEFGNWYSEKLGIAGAKRRAEAFLDAALTRRNHAWMEPLLPALAEGGAFVGVGALHLPGEDGVIELIRQAGYDVTRID
ncbi:MAG: TraB/GumN family protein [Pseudomonadota bacterium]